MENSKIEWTDHTFNHWSGCTKVSPGCANCYAESLMDKRLGKVNWGKGNPRQRTSEANWKKPTRWNKIAGCFPMNPRPRVFCASLADWLDPEVPIEWLADLLDLICSTPHLDWLLLTKRPELWYDRIAEARLWVDEAHTRLKPLNRALSKWLAAWLDEWHGLRKGVQSGTPHNVWIGTSVEDQQRADERIPELLKIPARVRFLSCEPLLGPLHIDEMPIQGIGEALLRPLEGDVFGDWYSAPAWTQEKLDWLIVGGESGPNARECSIDWIQSIVQQCESADVPVFVKQLGALSTTCNANLYEFPDSAKLVEHGEGFAAGRLVTKNKKGGDLLEWPDELQIREVPMLTPSPREAEKMAGAK